MDKTSVVLSRGGGVDRSSRFRTPNVHERACGLWVDRIGWCRERGPGTRKLRILGLYALVAVEEGQGTVATSVSGECPVEAGDVIVVPPEAPMAYGPAGAGWLQRWMVWGGPAADAMGSLCGFGSLGPVVRGGGPAVTQAYGPVREWMADESLAAALGREGQVRGLLARVLECARQCGPEASRGEALGQTVLWLEGQLDRPLPTAELARHAGLGETQFRKWFAERMGTSPHAFVAARRLARAKALLAEGLRVRQVAKACGYPDEYYFMRVFKKATGLTPGAWRAQSCEGAQGV